MNPTHTPYHFVPLSSWIYMPDWAHRVSHDHPMEEGVDGVIEFTLNNLTKLLVGAESTRQEGRPALVTWARDPNGQPIIPGSSLKGMLRNVLEIATFGKFNKIDDKKYSYRDISNSDTAYSKLLQESILETAWLAFDSNKARWTLRPCQHTTLFSDDFSAYTKKPLVNKSHGTALSKYEQWPLNSPAIPFNQGARTMDGIKGKPVSIPCAIELGKGQLQGYPVFLGYRPGPKDYQDKRLNFNYLFYGAEDQTKEISASDVAQMFSAHNEDLVNYLKLNGHPDFGIPVFIRKDKDRSTTLAMGLAKMPRVFYKNSIAELAEQYQKALSSQSVFDFSDLLFGSISDVAGFSLKGRVYISDALCDNNQGITTSDPVILGQPKPSYLNAYLEQSESGDTIKELKTYQTTSRLKGWKRYPAQENFSIHLPDDLKSKTNVQSQLEMMEVNSQFSGRIVFHNLTPIELGALLWTLAPLNEPAFCHALGHGKSLGAGAVQITAKLARIRGAAKLSEDDLRQAFEAHMNSVYPSSKNNWRNSPQIRHLLAFGNRADNKGKDLNYMPLNSKDPSVASYSGSKKGREKNTLPAWSHHGEKLSRQEIGNTTKTSPQVGEGRLSGLIAELGKENKISQFEHDSLEQAKETQAAEQRDASRANASAAYRDILDKQDHLLPYKDKDTSEAANQRQAMISDIDKIVQHIVEQEDAITAEEWTQTYRFLTDMKFSAYFDLAIKPKDLNKKAKEKYANRKIWLSTLQKRFTGKEDLA